MGFYKRERGLNVCSHRKTYHGGDPLARMHGTVEHNGGLDALAGATPEPDTSDGVAVVGGARRDDLGLAGVGSHEVLEEGQVVGVGVVRVEPALVGRAGVGLEAGLVGDGDAEVLVHGEGLETLGLSLEGGQLGGRDDNVGVTANLSRTLPGLEAEVGDDLVQLGGVVTGGDTEDLVAIVRSRLGTTFGTDGGGGGKAQEGGEDGEGLHGGGGGGLRDAVFSVAAFSLLIMMAVDGSAAIL